MICEWPGTRTIVHGLKVVHQGEDVLVPHGDSLEHRDLVANLYKVSETSDGLELGGQLRTMCSRPAMSLLLMTLAA